MKPLIVLIVIFILSIPVIKLITQKHDLLLAARIAMCSMLFFTAVGHFVFTKGMAMMVPSIMPLKVQIIYLTGVLEILLGIGLMIPKYREYTAWILIVFFIVLLPANIKAAVNHIDYQKATFEGNGLNYLWFRIPLQLLFIFWTYWSTIKK